MKGRSPGSLRPVYQVAVRRWLQMKFLSAEIRGGLIQGIVWLALVALLLWGIVGLVAAPLY